MDKENFENLLGALGEQINNGFNKRRGGEGRGRGGPPGMRTEHLENDYLTISFEKPNEEEKSNEEEEKTNESEEKKKMSEESLNKISNKMKMKMKH